ncbi:hypothetical protein BH10PLA2_BH10PLA2_37810 [soil metagenome]
MNVRSPPRAASISNTLVPRLLPGNEGDGSSGLPPPTLVSLPTPPSSYCLLYSLLS